MCGSAVLQQQQHYINAAGAQHSYGLEGMTVPVVQCQPQWGPIPATNAQTGS